MNFCRCTVTDGLTYITYVTEMCVTLIVTFHSVAAQQKLEFWTETQASTVRAQNRVDSIDLALISLRTIHRCSLPPLYV